MTMSTPFSVDHACRHPACAVFVAQCLPALPPLAQQAWRAGLSMPSLEMAWSAFVAGWEARVQEAPAPVQPAATWPSPLVNRLFDALTDADRWGMLMFRGGLLGRRDLDDVDGLKQGVDQLIADFNARPDQRHEALQHQRDFSWQWGGVHRDLRGTLKRQLGLLPELMD